MAYYRPPTALAYTTAEAVADTVTGIADDVADAARGYAPPERIWQTMGDALVRHTHRKANGQGIPGNLRFIVPTPQYDREHYDPSPNQLLRFPGDRDGGTPGNTYNCRCVVRVVPDGIARHIRAGRAVVTGSKVTASITASYPRIADSELGTDKDTPARFMGRAAVTVASRLRT